jgi:OOP family OmpA-OmpF porin
MRDDLCRRTAAALAALLLVITAFAIPEAAAQSRDFKGTQDPPGMKRFKGSVIHGQITSSFTEYELVIGATDWTKQGALRPTQALEGRLVRTVYIAPKAATPLEVSRNYEDELKAGGFEILFRCRNARNNPNPECGQGLVRSRLFPNNTITKQGERIEFAGNVAQNLYYFAAKLAKPEGDFYVALATWEATDAQLNTPFLNQTVALLDTIQTKRMDRQMVFVDAGAMQSAIEKDGRISLYGILFDTNSAVLKPGSERTLAEIARLLTRNPGWKLLVVGHTDNVAAADYNLRLSMQRAQAVVAALTQNHGVSAARLRAEGKGLTQPVASNDNEAGRAQNRRVELIRE